MATNETTLSIDGIEKMAKIVRDYNLETLEFGALKITRHSLEQVRGENEKYKVDKRTELEIKKLNR